MGPVYHRPTIRSMFQWTDEQQMIRDAVRGFVEKEIKPNLEELEHGSTPPYDILRKLFQTFGMDAMARDSFQRRIAKEKAGEASAPRGDDDGEGGGGGGGMMMIPI